MITLTLSEIANALNGTLLGEDKRIEQVTTDSRMLVANDVFLALKGPNFDGHRFIEQVAQMGCSAVIVEHQCDTDLPQIVVENTHQALGRLGAYVREKVAPKVVGITGSSGKTTVKEMVAAILARLGNVLATKGNFNNDIGVPLTLLRLEQQHDYAVIEMGANHMGEIAYTTNLVKPDVAIINNIAAAHLEGFGDLCGVARAKGEIFDGLSDKGVAIYNQDCQLASKWQWRLTDKTVRKFSCHNQADVYSSDVMLNEDGCATFTLNSQVGQAYIELNVPGTHNVCNAVAAAAIALEMGASLDDIRLGLADMLSVKGRLNVHQLSANFKLIDDTYNANVESIKAASELLASFPGRRILIIGDMGELGADARKYHHEVGEHAAQCKIDQLLTLGVLSQSTTDGFNGKTGDGGQHFIERESLLNTLKALLVDEQQHVSILVKGSRSAHMEKVVNDIIQWRESLKEKGQC
ncbi:UDP-N-acetylmuramoyl-tripeptide--D-alanyl-D-alanine ligase [Thalassotalea ganghwensis]